MTVIERNSTSIPVLISWLLLATGSVGMATAGEGEVGPYSVTPTVGYRDGGRFELPRSGESHELDGGGSVGLILGYEPQPGTRYELQYFRQRTRMPAAELDVDLTYIQIGGRLDWPGEHFVPYLSGGIGATRINGREPGLGSTVRPGMSLAGGLEWPLGERLAVRMEARGYLTLTGGDRGILCVSEPGDAFCRLAYRGDVLGQVELLGGLSLRF